jgi:hypothetical protein
LEVIVMKVCSLLCVAGVLLSAGTAAAQTTSSTQLRGFSVVLVEGSQQAGASADLPPAARAALDDVKDFLPFKSYRLLDSSWTLGSNSVPEYSTRLRGVEQDYQVRIGSNVDPSSSQVQVRFTLSQPDGLVWRPRTLGSTYFEPAVRYNTVVDAYGRQVGLAEEEARLAALEKTLASLRQRLNETHPEVRSAEEQLETSRRQLETLRRQVAAQSRTPAPVPAPRTVTPLFGGGSLIETSFTMRLGETVVVGTSRVGGDKALIALLTAVPSSSK